MDTLLNNGICRQPTNNHNKTYKSFSNLIEGKRGRFHEILLMKQVDYLGACCHYHRSITFITSMWITS
ncbi:DNA-directed RNA polymerase subunit beta', partial [Mucuna pruriens]